MLTDAEIHSLTARDKAFKRTDGRGLYLLVTPRGGKYWRFDYRLNGKRKTLAFGVYPDMTLETARARLDAARRQLALGVDPKLRSKATYETRMVSDTGSIMIYYSEDDGQIWLGISGRRDGKGAVEIPLSSVQRKWIVEELRDE